MEFMIGALVGSAITSILIFFFADKIEKNNKPNNIILPGQRWDVQNLGKVTIKNVTWTGMTPTTITYKSDDGHNHECPGAVFFRIARPIKLQNRPTVTVTFEEQKGESKERRESYKVYDATGRIKRKGSRLPRF